MKSWDAGAEDALSLQLHTVSRSIRVHEGSIQGQARTQGLPVVLNAAESFGGTHVCS